MPVSFSNKLFGFFMRILSCVQSVISLFLGGERCVRCGRFALASPLCSECAEIFSRSAFDPDNRCEICGKPLVSEIGICSSCRKTRTLKSADRIFPLQTYRLWKKNLLFSWKMQEKRSLSPFFASLVENKIRQAESIVGENSLQVVPVPPRPRKIRKNGWDQIDEICFYLKNGFGRKILPVLVRKSVIQQKKLGRIQRLESIGSSYAPASAKKIRRILKHLPDGKLPDSVVLLDDVMTTGATLEDCSSVLKKMGVAHVYCVTLFTVA